MDLEKVTAEIRPRGDWEAVDLGVSLVRTQLGTLWRAWSVTVLPLSLLILGVFFQNLGWGLFLIWWLKPIWDRVALFPLSRNLFGEKPDLRATMRVLPRELRENWILVTVGVITAGAGILIHQGGSPVFVLLYWSAFIALLFYRSSFYRSFVLPVHFLEGLRGREYRVRVALLTRRGSGAAFCLTVTALLMEFGLFYSQFFFLQLMVPEGTDYSFWSVLWDFFRDDSGALPAWLMIVIALAYWMAMTLTSWFYTGGGFGLYVNSRTWSEGWDIELTFKRLAQRIGVVVVVALGIFSGSPEVWAETPAERISEVMRSEDFEVQTRVERVSKKEDREIQLPVGGGGSLAGFGSLFFWAVLIAAVGGIVWLVLHNRQAFAKAEPTGSRSAKMKIKTLSGMQISPESLPDDVLGAARLQWRDGDQKEALGLLYRGAIASLIENGKVEIEESDTESDCLRRLASDESVEASYFALLTAAWMGVAYAKVVPEEAMGERLFEEWPFAGRRKR